MLKKDNKTFVIFSAIGIILVVFGHMPNSPNLVLSNLFPLYSFHMPLFIFISGYFFREQDFLKYFIKKIKKLIIPYFVYRFFYAIVINLLKNLNVVNYGEKIDLYNMFIAPFTTHGNQYFYNVASWFIITLFFIQVIYMLLYKVINKLKIKNDYVLLILFIILSCYSMKLERLGVNYTIIRILFLLPFYQIGIIYKSKLEKHDKLNTFLYFIIILLVQTILLQTGDITYNLNLLIFNRNYLIYLLASITGIAFWLRISKILTNYIGDNKIVNYIGNNTFSVMMNHVFSYFVLNICGVLIYKMNIGILDDLDINAFRDNVWFVVGNFSNVGINTIYIIFAIAFPLMLKFIYEKYISKRLFNIYEKCKGVKNE